MDSAALDAVPDPNDPSAFRRSKLDWECARYAPHGRWLGFYRSLLELRGREIVPRLAGMRGGAGRFVLLAERGLKVQWHLGDDTELILLANLDGMPLSVALDELPAGKTLYAHPPGLGREPEVGRLPPWSVVWLLRETKLRK
jgi:maltooligosyltrehalose trehalohydrolase